MRILSRVGFAHRELADRKSQEIEAHLSLIGGERVRDARFRWTQL